MIRVAISDEQIAAEIFWSAAPWHDEGAKGVYQIWAVYQPQHGGDVVSSALVSGDDPRFCQILREMNRHLVDRAVAKAKRAGIYYEASAA